MTCCMSVPNSDYHGCEAVSGRQPSWYDTHPHINRLRPHREAGLAGREMHRTSFLSVPSQSSPETVPGRRCGSTNPHIIPPARLAAWVGNIYHRFSQPRAMLIVISPVPA